MTIPVPTFDHLLRLSNDIGTFEHADHAIPRREHGYCTDDLARVLVVVARELRPGPEVVDLGGTAFEFLCDAQDPSGTIRNRRSAGGTWQDERGVEDCWGRSLWGFGTAAARSCDRQRGQQALAHFDLGAGQRSPWPRAMAFAALGAAEVLTIDPDHQRARQLLGDAADAIGPMSADPAWPWPEARLTYANAVLPEVLLAAGSWLARSELVEAGLTLLRWLLHRETVAGHLSPTPVGGAGPDDRSPAFDQQPLEAAAMADACWCAAKVTGDAAWLRGVELAVGWFTGHNDVGAPMWDPQTGGGYDGLHRTGPNLNQGAESTLAMIATLQYGRRRSRRAG